MRCLSAWKHFLIKYFDTHAHGDIMSIYTNDIDTLRQMISQSIPQLICQCDHHCQCIGKYDYSECAAYHRDSGHGWSYAGGQVRILQDLVVNIFMEQQKNLGIVNGYIEEMMEGQKVVKVFCHEEESH